MLYQIIDDSTIARFRNLIEVDGTIYTNDIARDIALESGEWHELIEDVYPDYDEDAECVVPHYELINNRISTHWRVIPIETESD